MPRWIVVGPLAVAVMAAGCAAKPLEPPAAATRNDAFLPYREIATAPIEQTQPGGGAIMAHLVARRDKASGALTTHAMLGVVYGQRLARRYEQARNARAEALPLRQLVNDGSRCRRQAGCAHLEMFQVDIPEADLRRAHAAAEGYPIKLFGRIGHATLFPIPKEMVAALLVEVGGVTPQAQAARVDKAR